MSDRSESTSDKDTLDSNILALLETSTMLVNDETEVHIIFDRLFASEWEINFCFHLTLILGVMS